MIEIPTNNGDNAKSRMEMFAQYCVNRFAEGNDYAEIADDSQFNGNVDGKDVPGITESEAIELARMFAAKGYHARAYYIDYPRHGFRHVTISTYVCGSSSARCSHTDKWA